MYIYVHTYIYIHMDIHEHVRMHIRIHAKTIYTYVCMNIHLHKHVLAPVPIYLYNYTMWFLTEQMIGSRSDVGEQEAFAGNPEANLSNMKESFPKNPTRHIRKT